MAWNIKTRVTHKCWIYLRRKQEKAKYYYYLKSQIKYNCRVPTQFQKWNSLTFPINSKLIHDNFSLKLFFCFIHLAKWKPKKFNEPYWLTYRWSWYWSFSMIVIIFFRFSWNIISLDFSLTFNKIQVFFQISLTCGNPVIVNSIKLPNSDLKKKKNPQNSE